MEKMEKIANDKNWKALIKPSKVDVKTHDNKSIATITAFTINSFKSTQVYLFLYT